MTWHNRFSCFAAVALLLVACSDTRRSSSDDDDDDGSGGGDVSVEAGGAGGGGSDGSTGGGGSAGGDGSCGDVAAIAGDFFFALSVKLSPKNPIVFRTTVTAEEGGLGLVLVPLAAADRATPVGDSVSVGPFAVGAAGAIDAQLPEITIPGEANPISGSPIVATARLIGTACTTRICGDVSGQATQPVMLDLVGSTFTMVRVTGSAYPEPPPINCAGDLANPLR